MATMRAVDIKSGAGPASSLFINTIPRPVPSAGQALVRVRAFGLNRMDISQREGGYPVPPQAPATLGVEFSGVVASLGDDGAAAAAGDFAVGDEVFGLAYGGAYAEYVAVSTLTLLHRPPHLPAAHAAAVPEAWMTATQALFLVGRFDEPSPYVARAAAAAAADGKTAAATTTTAKTVLWHAGASGVSMAGIQLARAAGAAAVYATAGTAAKCDFVVRELGAAHAACYRENPAWDDEIVAKVGEQIPGRSGVDLVVDFVGSNYFQRNLDVTAAEGTIVMLGLLSGGVIKNKPEEAGKPALDITPILRKRLRIEGSTLRARDTAYQGKLRDKLQEYLPKFESGEFKLVIDRVLPWEQIREAHEFMEANSNTGKIVCTIEWKD